MKGVHYQKMLVRAAGLRCLTLGDWPARPATDSGTTCAGRNLTSHLILSGGTLYETAENSFQACG